MKWILFWTIFTAQGGVTSGSETIDNLEACFAAQKAFAGVAIDARAAQGGRSSVETVCFNPATGEKKSFLSPK